MADKLYGISNCDTVKKARQWLEKNHVDYQFVDFRKDGLSQQQVKTWLNALGIDKVVNKRSTTWKALSEADKKALSDVDNNVLTEGAATGKAIDIIVGNPTLIKRPVLERSKGSPQLGFKEADYKALYGK